MGRDERTTEGKLWIRRSFPYLYIGPLKGNPIVEKAHRSFDGQCQRCNNPKHKNYRWYGARGIKVEYTAREFIAWFLIELEIFQLTSDLPDKKISIGRIDHDKNYGFGNIHLQSMEENLAERNRRVKRYKQNGG